MVTKKRLRASDFPSFLGKRFSELTVIEVPYREGRGKLYVKVRCSCAVEKRVSIYHIMSGATVSCGHVRGQAIQSHGHARRGKISRTWRAWNHMRVRCSDPKCLKFSYYGGRGIKVCWRWEKFSNFLADMGECPTGLSLDRRNSNGNYTKKNCRWATIEEQMQNRSMCKLNPSKVVRVRELFDTGLSMAEISRQFNVGHWVIRKVIRGLSWKNV